MLLKYCTNIYRNRLAKLKGILPVLFTVCVFVLFYVKRFVALKYYPPICNAFLFMVFFTSLFSKETIIQKIARAYGDKLEKPALVYTRIVTYVWCFFMFINLLVSIWTIFLSDRIWFIYNGCVSYILIGLLFITEYSIRIILRKRKLI